MLVQMSIPLIAMDTFSLKPYQIGLILSYCGMIGVVSYNSIIKLSCLKHKALDYYSKTIFKVTVSEIRL